MKQNITRSEWDSLTDKQRANWLEFAIKHNYRVSYAKYTNESLKIEHLPRIGEMIEFLYVVGKGKTPSKKIYEELEEGVGPCDALFEAVTELL